MSILKSSTKSLSLILTSITLFTGVNASAGWKIVPECKNRAEFFRNQYNNFLKEVEEISSWKINQLEYFRKFRIETRKINQFMRLNHVYEEHGKISKESDSEDRLKKFEAAILEKVGSILPKGFSIRADSSHRIRISDFRFGVLISLTDGAEFVDQGPLVYVLVGQGIRPPLISFEEYLRDKQLVSDSCLDYDIPGVRKITAKELEKIKKQQDEIVAILDGKIKSHEQDIALLCKPERIKQESIDSLLEQLNNSRVLNSFHEYWRDYVRVFRQVTELRSGFLSALLNKSLKKSDLDNLQRSTFKEILKFTDGWWGLKLERANQDSNESLNEALISYQKQALNRVLEEFEKRERGIQEHITAYKNDADRYNKEMSLIRSLKPQIKVALHLLDIEVAGCAGIDVTEQPKTSDSERKTDPVDQAKESKKSDKASKPVK